MPVIKLPVYDANGMQTSYTDYTTTNNTATGWGGRRTNKGSKALASNLYPRKFRVFVDSTEPA